MKQFLRAVPEYGLAPIGRELSCGNWQQALVKMRGGSGELSPLFWFRTPLLKSESTLFYSM